MYVFKWQDNLLMDVAADEFVPKAIVTDYR